MQYRLEFVPVIASDGLRIPSKNNPRDAGWDIYAGERVIIPPGERRLVRMGWRMQLFERDHGSDVYRPATQCVIELKPRSGLALAGIDVCGGIVDLPYTGDVGVILHNHSRVPFSTYDGDTPKRIAQFILQQCLLQADIVPMPVERGQQWITDRGQAGFGSSGR